MENKKILKDEILNKIGLCTKMDILHKKSKICTINQNEKINRTGCEIDSQY